jgi:glycosidase
MHPWSVRFLLGLLLPILISGAQAGADDAPVRPRIYQLFLRQFSNTNETRQPNGTLAVNGVGKFRDLDSTALKTLRDLGVTHVYLLGVLRQATGTDYSRWGLPADDPDLLKGVAGSPFAIRDYFDVCPDFAENPAQRLAEFRDLVDRLHREKLRVLVDFVPNHVARSYQSVQRPELSFGLHDDRSAFFSPSNNFYYLTGAPPLRLPTVKGDQVISPTCAVVGGCDGLFAGERDHGKVTGNNVVQWSPSAGDWYETVKLNYGFDFRQGRSGPREFPTRAHPDKPLPDTWLKMDAVLAHWQSLGVDGFRCDMAHWIPLEFWEWALARARQRNPATYFVAEAYDNDPNKLTDGNVLQALVRAGFDAVYDDQSYDILKEVYDGKKWANDLDGVLGSVAPLHASLRYAENHDEVRLANPREWGGHGASVGLPVSAVLFAVGRGPVLVYNGQEVGEPGVGAEGFGGDDGRTSIFDYGSLPHLTRWVNGRAYDGGRLTAEEKRWRREYARLLNLLEEPALKHGEFFPLNRFNSSRPEFGRLAGESAGGHWLYTFLRVDPKSGQRILVVANLHPTETFRGINVRFPPEAEKALQLPAGDAAVTFNDQLEQRGPVGWSTTGDRLRESGLNLPDLPALNAWYLEIR